MLETRALQVFPSIIATIIFNFPAWYVEYSWDLIQKFINSLQLDGYTSVLMNNTSIVHTVSAQSIRI